MNLTSPYINKDNKEMEVMYSISLLSNIGSLSDIYGRSGIAHVCEHSALAHHMDFHSCSLLFCMDEEYVAIEQVSMIDDIISGRYLTEYSLDTAKDEVIAECSKRHIYDKNMSKIISFVTDGAINGMPTGEISEIQLISLDDALNGNPFGNIGSLIYAEHDSERIHQFVYMPKQKPSLASIEHKKEVQFLITEGNSLRIYLSMPTCATREDILLRAIVEFIFHYRIKNRNEKIRNIYHKHYFKEYSHLIVAFDNVGISTEEYANEIVAYIGDSNVSKKEAKHAISSIAERSIENPINSVIADMQSYLSYGTPSVYQLKHDEIQELLRSISIADISNYLVKLFTNIHIVMGRV